MFTMIDSSSYQLYFLIGNSTADFDYRNPKIQEEIKTYNDLVIGAFEDNYENLPVKTFLGYKFLNEKCSYEYATFTDDDCMLNLKSIQKFADFINLKEPSVNCIKGKKHPRANLITVKALYSGVLKSLYFF